MGYKQYSPGTFILHPQKYRDLRYADYLLKWSAKPWYKRWFSRKPKYEDIELDVEKSISEMYREQLERANSELLNLRLREVNREIVRRSKND